MLLKLPPSNTLSLNAADQPRTQGFLPFRYMEEREEKPWHNDMKFAQYKCEFNSCKTLNLFRWIDCFIGRLKLCIVTLGLLCSPAVKTKHNIFVRFHISNQIIVDAANCISIGFFFAAQIT